MSRDRKIQSNLKRCPLLKVTRKYTNDEGEEVVAEEFNDCYKSFCAAWDRDKGACSYFTSTEEEETEEGDE